MGMMDRLATRLGYEKRAAEDPSWAALAPGIGAMAGMSARAAENLSAVLACTGVIASSLASIPVLIYRRQGDGRLEMPSHPLARITREGVTAAMTWPEFIEHVVASTLLTGNGLAEILRGPTGELSGLRYIPWGMVTVAELSSGRLAYDVSDGRGRSWRLLAGEVIHLRDRTDDGLIGRSRISRAGDAVTGALAANDFARNFLNNGAQPSGILEFPAKLTPEQFDMLRRQMDERHTGAKKAGRVMILDGGAQWKAAQISPEDAELLESRKFAVEEICRIYQVPPPLVQDYSHNTFTNSETAGRWFAMFTLAPWARKIEAEFGRSVFPAGSGLEMELDLSGFLRGDPATRWNAHKIAIEAGVLDADEVRQVEGWNPRTASKPVTAEV